MGGMLFVQSGEHIQYHIEKQATEFGGNLPHKLLGWPYNSSAPSLGDSSQASYKEIDVNPQKLPQTTRIEGLLLKINRGLKKSSKAGERELNAKKKTSFPKYANFQER